MKITASAAKEIAKRSILAHMEDLLRMIGAERYGSDFELAVPTVVEGQEIWVKVDLTAAQWKDTKVSPLFDPFVKREEYDREKAFRDAEKAAKLAAKAAKVAKSSKNT